MNKKENIKVFLYTLSTCIWCKKTKALLRELGLEFDFVDVDLQRLEEQQNSRKEMENKYHSFSFPTIVIDDGREVITGFGEEKIRKLAK